MNIDQAHEKYNEQIDLPHGSEFAATVGRFQEGFLADRVTDDVDEAFRRAVETATRMLPVIKLRAKQLEGPRDGGA